jgi:NADH pyrophosphatase NudC (nudix superfamily)
MSVPEADDHSPQTAEGVCALGAAETTGEYWRWCPRCGHELHNEKCKLRCSRCQYFMSCSDFD